MADRLLRFLADPRRARLSLLLTVLAGLLSLAVAGGTWLHEQRSAQAAVYPLADPLANLNQVGVNADLTQYDEQALAETLSLVHEGGLRWVRQRFPWDEIEPRRGEFDWAAWDALVASCTEHDLRLIAVLDGAPVWARSPDGDAGALSPPQETATWGDFAEQLAARYRGHIGAYQLWDEPNLSTHWGGRYVDPVGYTALLREGAIRIRQADPGAVILLAALAPTIENGPLNLNEAAFLRQVIQAGGRPFFDVVSLQPYGFSAAPSAQGAAARLDFGRAAWVRQQMVDMGIGDAPVWATSWGWNAAHPASGQEQSPWPSVDRELQVRYSLDALDLARRNWPWMGPMILQTWQPSSPASAPQWGFALLDEKGQPGELYTQLARSIGAPAPLHTGQYRPAPDSAAYVGAWRFSDQGIDPPYGADADLRNAAIAFDFYGSALDLTVRRGDFWGVLYVSVDGLPARPLPRDETGRAYLVLYDPLGSVESVHLARGMSATAPHHVELVAHGGWGQWPIVGWTVYADPAALPGSGAAGLLLTMGIGWLAWALGRVIGSPSLIEPVCRLAGIAFRRYRALPEWIPILLTLAVSLAFVLVGWSPAALALLGALFVLFFLRIDLGLAVVAFALPFYLQPKTLFGRPFSMVELGIWLCALAWITARLLDAARAAARSGSPPIMWRLQQWDLEMRRLPGRIWDLHPLDKGMAALVLIAALSLNWTSVRSVAVRELRTVFAESALFYALIRLALRSSRSHWRLVEGWLAGATAIALLGVAQALTGQNLIAAQGVWRVRGLYGSPNNLALYLERAWPMLVAVAWLGKGRARRIVYGVAAAVVLAGLLLTMSRGALVLGLPAALLALGLLQRRRRATWMVLGALAALTLILLPLAFTERFQTTFDLRHGSGFFRLQLWRSAWSMIADHPLTGVGMDNFLYAYRTRYVLPSAWAELDLSHPHNLFLDAWTRLGLLGVAALTWLFIFFFRAVLPRLRSAVGDQRTLLLGLAAAMVAALAHGLVDQAVFVLDLAYVLALLLALAAAEPHRR